jgi:hypothetical protein
MPKQASHSSHLIKIALSDGRVSFRRLEASDSRFSLRHGLGSECGEELISWVSTNKSRGAARIRAIMQLIAELMDLSQKRADAPEHKFAWMGTVFTARAEIGSGFSPKMSDREAQLASDLNLRLLRYKVSPWLWKTLGQYPILGWWSGVNRPADPEDPASHLSFTEHDAIVAIVDLAREGLLGKLRRCYCNNWFFAGFSHQKFCCVRCQQKYYRSSEDYKAMRRAYMKDLRKLHRQTYLVGPKERARREKRIIPP